MTSNILEEIKELCIEHYIADGYLNMADVIYTYIDEHGDEVRENEDFDIDDDDVLAEELGLLLDEHEIIQEAKARMRARGL